MNGGAPVTTNKADGNRKCLDGETRSGIGTEPGRDGVTGGGGSGHQVRVVIVTDFGGEERETETA